MKPRTAHRKIPAYSLYGEAPQRLVGRLLHIETIEARSAKHHWKIAPHIHHSLFQMVFVLRGNGVAMSDGKRSQYMPPTMMLVPSGTVHGFEFEPGTRGHVISVSTELMHELKKLEPAIAPIFEQPWALDLRARDLRGTDLVQCVRMLAREFARPVSGDGLALRGWLEVLLGNLLRIADELPNPADQAAGQRRQLMTQFSELIEQRFRENRSVADFARSLNLSESRLRSVCLTSTGQSPIQLIHARILLEAKRQLHYTSNPVSEIAYALGFEDAAYFTRFFSRLTGTSPKEFRRKGQEKSVDRM